MPVLEAEGYEFIWRPTIGEEAPFYAWFIKRGPDGTRTYHIHMVEPDEASEDRVLFRDHLRTHPADVRRYEKLKRTLSEVYPNDRAAYTKGKTDFIATIVQQARSEHP
ncbi:MAG: GrpB family protein [Flavobacteriales bacterium]|nr:GrpB family protein [Flavobacteriales bacterium]